MVFCTKEIVHHYLLIYSQNACDFILGKHRSHSQCIEIRYAYLCDICALFNMMLISVLQTNQPIKHANGSLSPDHQFLLISPCCLRCCRVLSSFHVSACLSVRLSVYLSVPNGVTTLTLKKFQVWAWNLVGWCTVHRQFSQVSLN